MYCNVSNKYRKLNKTEISYIFRKTLSLLSLSIFYSIWKNEYEIFFKEVESIEILEILGLINYIIRKYIIMSEKNINQEFKTGKYRSDKKLFNWRNKLKWINE